jgi:hypothetical protein
MNKRDDLRTKALKDLRDSEVLMLDGHFDYGNGYHGRVYLNPHQLFRHPSTIWRFAQDLIDVMPSELVQRTEVVAGPVTGGALLAHTLAGLLDSRRSLTHPPTIAARRRSISACRTSRWRSTARRRTFQPPNAPCAGQECRLRDSEKSQVSGLRSQVSGLKDQVSRITFEVASRFS